MTGDRWPYTAETRARIAANLARHERVPAAGAGLRAAAVSVVLAPVNGGAGTAFLLTRRTPRLKAHSGQYALPGGRIDAGETPLAAARRELAEELGVTSEEVLGALDDLPTTSGYLVTPFVMWLGEGAALDPSPHEIAAVFSIPLSDLFAGRGRGGNRLNATGAEHEPGVFSLFIPTLGHDVFAPTAAMLDHFREVALLGRSTPPVRFAEPKFARR